MSTSVARAEAAFNVQIDNYKLPGGRTAYVNTSAPEAPVSVSGEITHILGLSNVAQASSSVGQVTPSSSGSSPDAATVPATGARRRVPPPRIVVVRLPTSLRTRMGLMPAPTNGRLGAGETIALAELEPVESSDIATYEACYGISTTVNTNNVDGGPGTGYGAGEASDDIEDLAGLAPDATIDVYQAPNTSLEDLYDVYDTIATNDTAQVVSSSWGQCEAIGGASFDESEEPIFEQMATQGQTMVVASGDTGSSECYRKNSSGELNVSDASSDPYVTGVGGTQLTSFGPPPSETVWNDQYGAGGGGSRSSGRCPPTSRRSAEMPSQVGLPVVHHRATTAGRYLMCPHCLAPPTMPSTTREFGAAGMAQAFRRPSGRLTALADQGCSSPAGFLDPALYANSGDFNDIKSGNNDDTSTGYTGGLFSATAGYDMADGLGSPTAALFTPGVLCTAETSTPAITSLSPNSGPTTGNTTVTITGTHNSAGAAAVTFGGAGPAKSFTVVSSTRDHRRLSGDLGRRGALGRGDNPGGHHGPTSLLG